MRLGEQKATVNDNRYNVGVLIMKDLGVGMGYAEEVVVLWHGIE